ncbi:MAG: ribulose-phosphate 3-epimerase [Phycisphaerae bacterium]|nr:ribulose-phosphate 3-epimerase [Phycisphaerae bacterium]
MKLKRGNPWRQLPGGSLIAPSLLACNFAHAGQDIAQVVAGGADLFHVDIMDGHFVPNLSMGPGFVKSIRKATDMALDVHLMVTDPAYFAERFAEAGADSITFHAEAAADPHTLIARLREGGLGVGVTLRPGTTVESIRPVLAEVDLVLVMTVEPGYGGQEFQENMLERIQALRGMLSRSQRLEVDGGINPATAARCRRAGADVYVAGENLFGARDIPAAVRALRQVVGGPDA